MPPNITIQDTWSSPSNLLTVPWAQFDGGGAQILPTAPHEIFSGLHFVDNVNDLGGSYESGSSITVQDGGTLELDGGMQLQGGTVTLVGNGTAGQGAAYSDGQSGNQTRLGSSSSSVTILTGDTSIGVGVAGNQLLMGPIEGVGNLTKIGPGKLAMEQFISNTFTGSLTIAEGELQTRTGKARNDLFIASGATFSQIGNLGLNQDADEVTVVDGTINVNSRGVGDTGPYSINIGTLSGGTSGLITATSTAATHTVNVLGDTTDGTYSGTISGTLHLVKDGPANLSLNGNHTHSEGTTINGGLLAVNGSLPATGTVTINSGGVLGGSGTVNGAIALTEGGAISPGSSVGTLVTNDQTWFGGGRLVLEMVDATGSAGSDWDLLDLNGTLSLDASLTNDTPFQIVLSGVATGFDNGQSASWLIVDAQNISGTFSANDFIVDASAFEVSNPLAGGGFVVSLTGGDLFLEFVPQALTVLENWRFANFGSHDNTGFGADTANPDSDSLVNLLEFAFGTDPNVSDAGALIVNEIGGTFTPGTPIVDIAFSPLSAKARFIRRVDHASSGITYTAQFSHDLDTWEDLDGSTAVQIIGISESMDYEAVEMDYPTFLSSGRKAHFYRLNINETATGNTQP